MDQSRKRSNHSDSQEVEGIPELIHNIQSRLPVKDAARTSVLSKLWLHAWSTIPTLRLHHIPTPIDWVHDGDKEHKINSFQLVDIDRTLNRYLRSNIPVEKFELIVEIENQQSACMAEKWLLDLATKTRVKELSVRIKLSERGPASFNLPLEILSSENLTELRVIADSFKGDSVKMESRRHPVIIKCVSLRELQLHGVAISQNIADGIWSSCRLLEKVELSDCWRDLNTIKIENLPCLYELEINTKDDDREAINFVIRHVPNLRVFSFSVHSRDGYVRPFNAHSISLGSNVAELTLFGGLIGDYTCLDMIKSGCPFLESLDLDMSSWMLGSFHFASDFIKTLFLSFCPSGLVDVQIYAPKLSHFGFDGNYKAFPSLLFPISSTLEKLDFSMKIDMHVDASFFLKLRETLALSRKCDLEIKAYNSEVPSNIDVNYLRRRLLLPPARNVELLFQTDDDECQWKRSPFFDAFFEICHPEQVRARRDSSFKYKNHFCRLMLKEVLEKKKKTGTTVYWPHYLEHVQIQPHENWETLTNSHTRLLEVPTPFNMLFKLKWH